MAHFHWNLDDDVTVGRALVAATQRLDSASLETPRLDSEVLLAYVVGWERARLYMYPDRRLSTLERTRFEELVDRRLRHEPIAYLVGRKSFFGLDLSVDPRVLIPRPETELLVELVLDLIGQAERRRLDGDGNGGDPGSAAPITLADVGTGSGAIAVAVAANHAQAQIFALDISVDALALAHSNAERHGLAHRINFLHGDLLQPLPAPVDVIVANLPYVALPEWQELPPDVAVFEPALALDGGADGLEVIRRLLAQAPAYLRPGGVLVLEVGSRQGAQVAESVARHFPDAHVELLVDYGMHDRIIWVQT